MSEKARLHFLYIIGILVSAIVALVTIEWASIPNLVDYLTFALTVASLLLALLAIGYAIVSNSVLHKNLGEFSGVATKISNNATALSTVTENLQTKIKEIPPLIFDVGKQAARAEVLLQELSQKAPTEPKQTSLNLEADPVVLKFFKSSSISGDLLVYGLMLSHQTSTPFVFEEFIEKAGLEVDYSRGFMVAIGSVGLFEYEFKNGIVSVGNFNSELVDGLPAILDVDLKGATSDEHREVLLARRKNIKEYFEE